MVHRFVAVASPVPPRAERELPLAWRQLSARRASTLIDPAQLETLTVTACLQTGEDEVAPATLKRIESCLLEEGCLDPTAEHDARRGSVDIRFGYEATEIQSVGGRLDRVIGRVTQATSWAATGIAYYVDNPFT